MVSIAREAAVASNVHICTWCATPTSLLIREGFSERKILMKFLILYLTLKRVVEGADDAESDEIFRTVHFGSPYDRSPPIFSNVCPKNLPQKVQLGMRLVARLGAFVQIVGSHCTLPRQFSLHDLPWQLCNYLGGKFSSRAACPLFPPNSASISEETEGRKRLGIFLKVFSHVLISFNC